MTLRSSEANLNIEGKMRTGFVFGFFILAVVPSMGFDHSGWDALLKRYVSEESRVDYKRWKQDDAAALNAYLKQLAKPWPANATPAAEKAALINAYNALTIRWILENYPVESIWKTSDPFKAKRHDLNGEKVSLDEIETHLRKMGDPRIHSALVCAARSCPPLRQEAYDVERLDEQLDDNTRAWLADPHLNEFLPELRTARVSKIFKWYRKDFEGGDDSLRQFLARYAPSGKADFLDEAKARIEHKDYHWGLNDASSLGANYSSFLWDRFRNLF